MSIERSKVSERGIYIKEGEYNFTISNTENRRELLMSFPKRYDREKAKKEFQSRLNSYELCQ